jgi:type IV secretory pathway VirB2 component (pilin)
MDTQSVLPGVSQRVLLACGILAPLLFIAADLIAGRMLKGYSFSAQSMSELSAEGSPTRGLVVVLNVVAVGMMTAFGVGVWRAGGQAFLPHVVAVLVILNAAGTLVATLFFPNTFGVRPVFASPGVLIMVFSVLCSVLAIIFGAFAYSGWFRAFSIVIPAAFVLLTVVRYATASTPASVAAGPMIGSQERTMAYTYFVWVMALAVYLLTLTGKAGDVAGG